ncbi:MAG: alpha/beta hydrolase [Christensenellaceae bacterium]|nr:alpha/beta hydrolase [Christensenellaceae bacterium]
MEMTAGGVTIHYELAGSGDKRVVLLHGWGCSTSLMKPVADFLSRDMTVLSIDFPAHGQSGRPPKPWGVPDFAACTLELLKKLDFLPCSVIAHSFGGRITIELASQDATLFERIILTGSAGIKDRPSEESRKRSAKYRRLKGLCEKAKAAKAFGKLPDMLEEKLRQKYGSKDYNALDAEMRKTFVLVVNHDQTDLLQRIQQPTLLLWGDKDTETPLWMGQLMEERIPDAGLVVFEGGTHFAYLEQLGRFNAIAHNFLME